MGISSTFRQKRWLLRLVRERKGKPQRIQADFALIFRFETRTNLNRGAVTVKPGQAGF
jgi:hypothetical protein